MLDLGVDPIALAALLRHGVATTERKSAYLDMVRSVGAPLADAAWSLAFAEPATARRSYPVAAREIAEAAIGQKLVGIHAVTGELVDLIATRMGTSAYVEAAVGHAVFHGAAGFVLMCAVRKTAMVDERS